MLGLLSSANVMAADGSLVRSAASTAYALDVVQQATITVKGHVTDPNGDPLVGVTVTEKGGKSTVITDIDQITIGAELHRLRPNNRSGQAQHDHQDG